MNRITTNDINIGIVWSQTGLAFLSYAHLLLVVAWAVGSILEGFSNGIFHMPPIALEIILVKIIADTLGFDILCRDTQVKQQMVRLVWIMLVIAIGVNITHLIFTGIELVECTSAICADAYWFLFTFSFILGILIALEIIMFGYFVKFDRLLKMHRE